MGSSKRAGLVTAATTAAFVALAPSALPGHAAAAPATLRSAAATAAPAQADGGTASGTRASDGGSPVNLLLAGGAVTGIGVLLLASHQPRPLTKRRRAPG